MELTWLAFIFYILGLRVILGQIAEKCFIEYGTEYTYEPENVAYVCTQSSVLKYTDVIYMDMSRVPMFRTSTCFCDLTINEPGRHTITVDYIHDRTAGNNTLIVEGFGVYFSGVNQTRNVITSVLENSLEFRANSTSLVKACLRFTLPPQEWRAGILFKVNCSADDLPEAPSNFTATVVTTISQEPISSSTEETTKKTSSSGISGAVIGGVVGGVIFLLVCVVIVVIVVVRLRRKRKPQDDQYLTASYGGSPNQLNQGSVYNYDDILNDPKASTERSNQNGAVSTDRAAVHDYLNAPKSLANGTEYISLYDQIGDQTDHVYNTLPDPQTDLGQHGNMYYNTGVEYKAD